jgi:hypothetical protein
MSFKIYQVYYNEYTKTQLNDCYIPFDNSFGDANEYEYGVMKKVYDQGFDGADYLGVISWKYGSKMNLFKPPYETGHLDPCRLHNIIWQMEGKYDVFHSNPHYHLQSDNPWKGASLYHHPSLTHQTQEMSELMPEISHWFTQVHDYTTSCFCNYWVGNKKMWDLYMKYAEMIYPYAKTTGDMFPYIMERIFPSVLASHQNDLKILPCGIK